MMKFVLKSGLALVAIATVTVPAFAANLLVNGNFEASTSQTATPPGWTNIGHTDGVIAYSLFGTPAFDGNYFYDIGGFGGAIPTLGDGIMQTVATSIGQVYTLSFGYTGENGNPGQTTVMDVLIGGMLTSFSIVSDNTGGLQKAFTATFLNYTATGASTTIAFTIKSSTNRGANDPVIDRVVFEAANAGAVPEPASWAMMIAGFGLAGVALRRRQRVGVRFA
jgi:hypothetical protein